MAKLFVVCSFLALVLADPGVLVGFTPDIVNSVLKEGLPKVEETLTAMTFPGFELPVVGTKGLSTDMAIENISVENIKLFTEKTGLSFRPSREVVLNIPDVEINLRFDWKLKSHVSKKVLQKGEAKVVVSQASILTSIFVTTDLKKVLTLNKCEFSIDKILIVLDGNSASGVLNWILDAVNRKLKKTIEKEINTQLNNLVESVILKVPNFEKSSWVALGPSLLFNSKVTEPFSINPNYFEAKFDGTFMLQGPEYEVNVGKPEKLAFSSQETLAVYISQYTINTWSLAQFKAQPLKFTSDSLGVKLTTDSLNPVFSGIVEDFGENKPCNMICTQLENSLINLKNSHLASTLRLSCGLLAGDSKVMTLLIDIDFEVTLSASNGLLTGSVSKLLFSRLDLVESHLTAEPDMENLRAFAKGLQYILRSLVSSKLFGSGILLPDALISYFPDLSVEIKPGQIVLEGSPSVLSY